MVRHSGYAQDPLTYHPKPRQYHPRWSFWYYSDERRMTGEEFLKGLRHHGRITSPPEHDYGRIDVYGSSYCATTEGIHFHHIMGLFRDHILRSQLTGSDLITFDIFKLGHSRHDWHGTRRRCHQQAIIRSCIYMLEGLYESDEENESEKLYLTTFEPAFLKPAGSSTRRSVPLCFEIRMRGTWLRQTKKRLVEEETRTQTTISMLTSQKIAKVIEAEMVSSHLSEFLAMEGSGIKAMIENDRYEDLTLLYQLISRVGSVQGSH